MHFEESPAREDLRAALGSILDRYSHKWARFILAILKNEEDVEDVIQEAVRRVLAHNRPLPSRDQIKMYLGRAIGNTALELYHHRKRERRRQIPIREHVFLPANTRSPYACIEEREVTAEREQMMQLLGEGLSHLPEKQYEAVRLTILESRGLSIRDVGVSTGIPYSTLRHRSQAGLKRLRKFLERSMAGKR